MEQFGTRLMESDGTVWNPVDDEPERVGGGFTSWTIYDEVKKLDKK